MPSSCCLSGAAACCYNDAPENGGPRRHLAAQRLKEFVIATVKRKDDKTIMYCSFCGKKPDMKYRKLIASQIIYIRCQMCWLYSIIPES